MPENQDKIVKFMQAITEHAAAQSRAVHREVTAYKRERLSEAEKKALADSTALIDKEHAALQKQVRLEMSRREFSARRHLLEERQQMTETLFGEAREKLIAFTDSDDYFPFLSASLAAMTSQLSENAVYYFSDRDEKRSGEIRALLPAGTAAEFTADITIGGVRAYDAANGIFLDDTLDTRLDEQRVWFASSSGLTIE